MEDINNNIEFYDSTGNKYTYENVQEMVEYIQNRITIKPKIGIICGFGLGNIANIIEKSYTINYENIPNFPVSNNNRKGNFIFGLINNVPIMCVQNRFYFYEGYPLWKCILPIRIMKLLGITDLIVSNTAGGLNPILKEGDIMLVKDHLNLMGFAGNTPLHGKNDSRFGPRFVSMSNAYDLDLLKTVKELNDKSDFEDVIKEGVYTCLGGPNFETVAELKALKLLGVDTVGMSTVYEVIAARHSNMTCFGFSLITHKCVLDYGVKSDHNIEEILKICKKKEKDLKLLVKNAVKCISGNKL